MPNSQTKELVEILGLARMIGLKMPEIAVVVIQAQPHVETVKALDWCYDNTEGSRWSYRTIGRAPPPANDCFTTEYFFTDHNAAFEFKMRFG